MHPDDIKDDVINFLMRVAPCLLHNADFVHQLHCFVVWECRKAERVERRKRLEALRATRTFQMN